MSLILSDISDAVFSFLESSDDDQRNMRTSIERVNLSQEQLDQAIYEKNRLPQFFAYRNLAEPREHPTLTVNPDRAYEWADRNGEQCRRFVESGEWIPNIDDESDAKNPDEESFLDQLWYGIFGRG